MWSRRAWGLVLGPLAVTFASGLAGCATPASAPASASSPQPQRFAGRVAVRVDASPTQGAQAGSFGFELVGTPEAGQFVASGPLGALLARVTWSADGALVEANGNADRFGSLAEAARQLAQALSLPAQLPVAAWFAWLRGQPLPGKPSTPAADGFSQFGWQVNTARAREGRLGAEFAGPPAASVRVVLDQP